MTFAASPENEQCPDLPFHNETAKKLENNI